MKRRNEGLIHVSAFLLVAALAAAALLAVFADQPGLGFLAAGVEDRPSVRYVFKTVRAEPAAGVAVVEPGGEGYENGAANIVTAVVADYRVLDTLGEVLVLFAAATGVGLLMPARRRTSPQREASAIVRTGVPAIMFLSLITGAYIVLHGHLSPGGGFSGGAVIASGFILRFLAGQRAAPRGKATLAALESGAGLALLAVGLAGLILSGTFFASFLPQGALGSFASAGILVIVYTLIGIKVAAELSALSADFVGGA
jgi:multicomponent Na+:H+ antiporter subunit B